MNMNAKQVRVIDPILTTHAQGFKRQNTVGHMLFPRANVFQSGGQVLQFGKEGYKKYNARRSPGDNTKRIKFGYEGKPYSLVQDSLEAVVPDEWQRDAQQVPGINLAKRAVNNVLGNLTMLLEIEQAELAMDPNNYSSSHKLILSGTSLWSDHTNSKPLINVADSKEVVRQDIGMDINTAVFSPKRWKQFRNHPDVRSAAIKDNDSERVVTTQMAADLLEVDHVVVGKGVYANKDGSFADIWGDGLVLAYVAHNSSGAEEPSFGYTYTMDAHPFVRQPYREENCESWFYGVKYERTPVIASAESAFLITE
ncbi:MAG: major capsid protein [Alphaproteobacteria bacterium]|nr:major capsid protein [Alphaproteobacteria bacterium]MDD9919774.1 major capsid protein [Alphaproteobacteria bacterium]